jgi:hypothetical protein
MLAAFNADTTRGMKIINFADCIMDGCYFSPDYMVSMFVKGDKWKLSISTHRNGQFTYYFHIQGASNDRRRSIKKYILFKDKYSLGVSLEGVAKDRAETTELDIGLPSSELFPL